MAHKNANLYRFKLGSHSLKNDWLSLFNRVYYNPLVSKLLTVFRLALNIFEIDDN